MSSTIEYIIEANLCLIILGLLYYILLRNEIDFKFRRFYILTTVLIILLSPFIHLPISENNNINIVSSLETIILPEVTIDDNASTSEFHTNTPSAVNVVTILYFGIAFLLMLNFLFQLKQIVWFYRSFKRKSYSEEGFKIIETNGTLPTFSFFRLIFFDNSINLTSAEKQKIIAHEFIHIKQYHSLDVLLLEIVKIICWFNPIAWILKAEAQQLHEFLADREVVKNTDQITYNSLLAKMTLTKAHLSLGHHFNKSQTIKRIAMMNIKYKSIRQWKRVLIIPIVLMVIVIISCNDQATQDVNTVIGTTIQTEMPTLLDNDLANLKRRYPQANFVYLEADASVVKSVENLEGVDPLSIVLVKRFKERNRIGFIVNKDGPIQNVADANGVFTIVDETAMPEGGYDAFYIRVSSQIKYPIEAKKMGIEGKVYVQFIVDQNGNITETTIVKGIGYGCDQAALIAVSNSGQWSIPKQGGKAVKQQLILPITFKLGDSKS